VVVLVLSLLITVGLFVASAGFQREAARHMENQAYYTALSVTQGFAEWFKSSGSSSITTEEQDKIAAFLTSVQSNDESRVVLIPGELPDNMGSCVVTITYTANAEFNGIEQDRYLISTAATYGNLTKTVELPVYYASSDGTPPFADPDFGPGNYDDIVKEIVDGTGTFYRDPEPINIFANQGAATYTTRTNSTATGISATASTLPDSSNGYADKRNFNNENRAYLAGVGNSADPYSTDPQIPAGYPGSADTGGYFIKPLTNPISSASVLNREATWYETDGPTGLLRISWGQHMSGPRDTPVIDGSARTAAAGQTAYNEDYVRVTATAAVVTPLNGKLVFNPMHTGVSGVAYNKVANSLPNVAFAMYNITDTADKDVRIRLANATGTPQMSSIGSNIDYPMYTYIGLDFMDNETNGLAKMQVVKVPGVTETAVNIADPQNTYNGNGVTTQTVAGVPFYPNTWKSCILYATNTSAAISLYTTLVFGNYGRVYSSNTASASTSSVGILDNLNSGAYVNHHYGYVGQGSAFASKLPSMTAALSSFNNLSGFPYPPVYWGNDFSMYLLDGWNASFPAWIMQGVNIVNKEASTGEAGGVIYSTRSLKIGGALITKGSTSATGYTDVTAPSQFYDGFAGDTQGALGNVTYAELERFQAAYHQVIKDTDIIITTLYPSSSNYSEICHPDSIKGYEGRTLTIEGGSIYVGKNCILQIDSEIKDGLAVSRKIQADGITPATSWGSTSSGTATDFVTSAERYTENGNRMYIKPDKIVVDGGTLIILGNQNDHYNVETDIYVKNGGTLTINAGAKIKGNIYCYGGGTVDIKGDFSLQGHTITVGGIGQPGGIFIYGEATKDPITGELLKRGNITLPSGNKTVISGSDGITEFEDTATSKGAAIHFLSETLFKDLPYGGIAKYSLYACTGHSANNGCQHYAHEDLTSSGGSTGGGSGSGSGGSGGSGSGGSGSGGSGSGGSQGEWSTGDYTNG
jgi:hypothetical protein